MMKIKLTTDLRLNVPPTWAWLLFQWFVDRWNRRNHDAGWPNFWIPPADITTGWSVDLTNAGMSGATTFAVTGGSQQYHSDLGGGGDVNFIPDGNNAPLIRVFYTSGNGNNLEVSFLSVQLPQEMQGDIIDYSQRNMKVVYVPTASAGPLATLCYGTTDHTGSFPRRR